MDLKSKNKALNIILSILIILTVIASAGGFLVSFFVSETQAAAPDYGYLSVTTIQDVFNNFIKFIKVNMTATYSDPEEIAAFVRQFFTYIAYIAAFTACGIVILINSIILLVQSIKGFSKEIPSGKLTRRMLTIAATFGIYIAIILGLVYENIPSLHYISGLGIGLFIQLSVAIMYIIISSIIHIAVRNDRKMVGRIFQVIITMLAFVAVIVLLLKPYDLGEGTNSRVISLVISVFGTLFSGFERELLFTYLLVISGCVFIIISLFTVSKLIKTPMGVDDSGKKVRDYSKSAIVKSSLFVGFFGIGLTILLLSVSKLVSPTQVKLGTPCIISIALAIVLLALSIVSKCVDKGPVEEKTQGPVDAVKEEIAAFVPVENNAPQIEPEPEETVILEEPPEEETQPVSEREPIKEVAGPNFCPNCGAPVKGSKFCSSCGSKLI